MSIDEESMSELANQAELRGEELTEEVKALAHPEILAELSKLTDLEAQVATLREKRDMLTDEQEQIRAEIRRKYREQNEKRFSDVNWKRALCGMPDVKHRVVFAGVAAFDISQPSAQREHEVSKFVVEKAEKMHLSPVTNDEAMLLAWLVNLEYLGNEGEQPKLSNEMPAKLKQIRGLAGPMLRRLAEEAQGMSAYLTVVLEEELGNS